VERQPLHKQFPHVGRERAMPVLNTDAGPLHPFWKFLQITIDRVV
jgi:hypothetical protein